MLIPVRRHLVVPTVNVAKQTVVRPCALVYQIMLVALLAVDLNV